MQRFRAWVRQGETPAPTVEHDAAEKRATDKEANVACDAAAAPSDSDEISVNAQAGVQDVEALAKVWTKKHLILAYIT